MTGISERLQVAVFGLPRLYHRTRAARDGRDTVIFDDLQILDDNEGDIRVVLPCVNHLVAREENRVA